MLKPKNQAKRELDKPRIRVEDVRIDTFEEERDVVILFRDLYRPECLFGYAWGPVGILEDDEYFEAAVCWANWEEELYAVNHGLPKECSPEEITWI